MSQNKPIFYRAVTTIIDRAAELGVTADQFIDGCNRGSTTGSIGINTGDYNPKAEDFSRDTPRYATPASYIGHLADAVTNNEDQMWGLPDTDDQAAAQAGVVGFDVAEADTAADATYGSSLTLTNYTGNTIPDGGWAWGFEATGGTPVAPIVDAGGPYTWVGYEDMAVSGSVVVGTDPNPTLEWVVISGAGSFADPGALDTTMATTYGDPATQIALIATPNDGPPVVSTVSVFIEG